MTSSFPSFVSPPKILTSNSFAAFPIASPNSEIFDLEYLRGIVTEIVPNNGLTPFALED